MEALESSSTMTLYHESGNQSKSVSRDVSQSRREHPSEISWDPAVNTSVAPKSRKSSIASSTCISQRSTRSHIPVPWLRRRISSENAIYILYTLSFLSAALDAASFTAWTAFLNMQTGNTVFLALGASGQPHNNPYAWITALGSISTFILGSAVFGALAKFLGPRTRLSLSASTFIQATLTVIAAVLIHIEYVPVPEGTEQPAERFTSAQPRELAAIMPLAFAAAGQVCATRELGFPLIPTLVLTTLYADAFRDTKLLAKGKQRSDNPMRSKMLITIVVFVCGAIAGGWISRSEAGMGAVVWTTVAWRFTVAGMWAVWPWEEVVDEPEWTSEEESRGHEDGVDGDKGISSRDVEKGAHGEQGGVTVAEKTQL